MSPLPSQSERPVGRSLIWHGLLFAVATAAALPIDLNLAVVCGGIELGGDLRRLVRYSEVFGHGIGVTLIILLVGTLSPRGVRDAALVATYAFGCGLTAALLKVFVARYRPYCIVDSAETIRDTFIWRWPFSEQLEAIASRSQVMSFPSGHVATAVGLAIALSCLYPRGRVLFGFFATLVAIERMYSQAHFLSDALSGAAIAFIVCGLIRGAAAGRWGRPAVYAGYLAHSG